MDQNENRRCNHFRVNVRLHRNYTDNGYDADVTCFDCGLELDVVNVS